MSTTPTNATCDEPSRYRYQRGCRCAGCVVAQAEYKRRWHETKAAEHGEVYGEKACELCGVAVSVLGSSNARRYCSECAALSKKEQDRRYKERVKEREAATKPGRIASGVYQLVDLPVTSLTMGDDVRLDEDADALEELAASIAEYGVLQPLVVRPVGDEWEVIAGRRRLAAARIAESETVPCVVRDLDDERAFDVTLAENLHRRDLSWIEVAMAYDRLRNRGLLLREIAELVGKSESQVSQVLKLLTLPADLQARVHVRELNFKAALDAARRLAPDNRGGRNRIDHDDTTPRQDGELARHWQRRHSRLLAGVATVIKAQGDGDELRQMLRRLLSLDRQPLDDVQVKEAS